MVLAAPLLVLATVLVTAGLLVVLLFALLLPIMYSTSATSPYGPGALLGMILTLVAEAATLAIAVVVAIVNAVFTVLLFVVTHLKFFLALAVIIVVVDINRRYQTPAIEVFDRALTKDALPFYRKTVLPIANAARLMYGSFVCAFDTYSGFNRVLEAVLLDIGTECTDMSWRTTLSRLVATLEAPGIVVGNFVMSNFQDDLDLYRVTSRLGLLLASFEPLFKCLCSDLTFLWSILAKLVSDDNLHLGANDVVNAVFEFARQLLKFLTEILQSIATGNKEGLFTMGRDSDRPPRLEKFALKGCSGLQGLGHFINNGLNDIFHQFVDESITFPRPGGAAAEVACFAVQEAAMIVEALFHIDLLFDPQVKFLTLVSLPLLDTGFVHGRNFTHEFQLFFDDIQSALHIAGQLIPDDGIEVTLPDGSSATLNAAFAIDALGSALDNISCVATNVVNATLGALQIVIHVGYKFANDPQSPFALIREEDPRLFLEGLEQARNCSRNLLDILNPVLGEAVYVVIDLAERLIQALGGFIIRIDSPDLMLAYLSGDPNEADTFFHFVYLMIDDIEGVGIVLGNALREFNLALPGSTARPPTMHSCSIDDFPLDATHATNLVPGTLFCCAGSVVETAVRMVGSLLRTIVLGMRSVAFTVFTHGSQDAVFTTYSQLIESIKNGFPGPAPRRLGFDTHLNGLINSLVCLPASVFEFTDPATPCNGRDSSSTNPNDFVSPVLRDIGVAAINTTLLGPYHLLLVVADTVSAFIGVIEGQTDATTAIDVVVLGIYDITAGSLVNVLRAVTSMFSCFFSSDPNNGLAGFGNQLWGIFGWAWPTCTCSGSGCTDEQGRACPNDDNFRSKLVSVFNQLTTFVELVVDFFTDFDAFKDTLATLIKCLIIKCRKRDEPSQFSFDPAVQRRIAEQSPADDTTMIERLADAGWLAKPLEKRRAQATRRAAAPGSLRARSPTSMVYDSWGDASQASLDEQERRLEAAFEAVEGAEPGAFDTMVELVVTCGSHPLLEYSERVSACVESCATARGACAQCDFGTVLCTAPTGDPRSPADWVWFNATAGDFDEAAADASLASSGGDDESDVPTPGAVVEGRNGVPCADLLSALRQTSKATGASKAAMVGQALLLRREAERCLYSAGFSRYFDVILLQGDASRPVVPRDVLYDGARTARVAHNLTNALMMIFAYQGNATLHEFQDAAGGGSGIGPPSPTVAALDWPAFLARFGEDVGGGDEMTMRFGLVVEIVSVIASARAQDARGPLLTLVSIGKWAFGATMTTLRTFYGAATALTNAGTYARRTITAAKEIEWTRHAVSIGARVNLLHSATIRGFNGAVSWWYRTAVVPLDAIMRIPTANPRLARNRLGFRRASTTFWSGVAEAARRHKVMHMFPALEVVEARDTERRRVAVEIEQARAAWYAQQAAATINETTEGTDNSTTTNTHTMSRRDLPPFLAVPDDEVCIGGAEGICIECAFVSRVLNIMAEIAFGCLADNEPSLQASDSDTFIAFYKMREAGRRARKKAETDELAAEREAPATTAIEDTLVIRWVYSAIEFILETVSGGLVRINMRSAVRSVGTFLAGRSTHPGDDVGSALHYLGAIFSCNIVKGVRPLSAGTVGEGFGEGLKIMLIIYAIAVPVLLLVPHGTAILSLMFVSFLPIFFLVAYDYSPRCFLGTPLLPDTLGDDFYYQMTHFDRQCIPWNKLLPGTVDTSATHGLCPTQVQDWRQPFIDPTAPPYSFTNGFREACFLLRWQLPTVHKFVFDAPLQALAWIRDLPGVNETCFFDLSASGGRIDDRWRSAWWRMTPNLAELLIWLLLGAIGLALILPVLVPVVRAAILIPVTALQLAVEVALQLTGVIGDRSAYYSDVRQLAISEELAYDETPFYGAAARPWATSHLYGQPLQLNQSWRQQAGKDL